jgi:hypothetical protein
MQIEGQKNVVADSVVFTGDAIHRLDLDDLALSTETRSVISNIATPVRTESLASAQSDVGAEAGH